MKYLIVARHKENVDWAYNLSGGWQPIIYHAGSSDHQPNSTCGCEAFSYLQEICRQWDMIDDGDEVAFSQGDPFPHCTNFSVDIETKQYMGRLHSCGNCGLPHCTYLNLDAYCGTFDIPRSSPYWFSEGAHFKTTGAKIHSHPKSFYEALRQLVNTPHSRDPKHHAMTMERLWFNIFDIKP